MTKSKVKKIVGYLENRQLHRANVDRRAEVIYYLIEDDDVTSMNSSHRRNIEIYFDSGEIDQVIFIDTPVGKVTPIEDLNPNAMYFRNFGWYDYLRPKSFDDIFIWKEK